MVEFGCGAGSLVSDISALFSARVHRGRGHRICLGTRARWSNHISYACQPGHCGAKRGANSLLSYTQVRHQTDIVAAARAVVGTTKAWLNLSVEWFGVLTGVVPIGCAPSVPSSLQHCRANRMAGRIVVKLSDYSTSPWPIKSDSTRRCSQRPLLLPPPSPWSATHLRTTTYRRTTMVSMRR